MMLPLRACMPTFLSGLLKLLVAFVRKHAANEQVAAAALQELSALLAELGEGAAASRDRCAHTTPMHTHYVGHTHTQCAYIHNQAHEILRKFAS